jgi:hypothetical protein
MIETADWAVTRRLSVRHLSVAKAILGGPGRGPLRTFSHGLLTLFGVPGQGAGLDIDGYSVWHLILGRY